MRPWLRVAGALFAVAWGGNQFTPLLVMYRQVDGLSSQTATLLLGAYVLGIVPAMLIGGPLSDRLGRRPLVYPAPFIAAAGSLVLAFGEASPWFLLVGRILSGVALGLAMAVGSSWVKELSTAPHDLQADAGAGARRASLAITAGLCVGAVCAATLAQFAPLPGILPYLVNVVVAVVLGSVMLGSPETRAPKSLGPHEQGSGARTGGIIGGIFDDLKVPAVFHRRFLLVILPVAPWAFGTATVAYAILPGIIAPQVPGFEVGFSGVLCLVALGFGLLVQPLARRLDSATSARSLILALAIGVLGVGIAAVAAATLNVVVTLVAAAVLGAGYGLLMVSGLLEIQRIAGPDDLAGLTGVYYALTYVGFFLPAVLATLNNLLSYTALFGIGVLLGLACLALLVRMSRTNLPAEAATAVLNR